MKIRDLEKFSEDYYPKKEKIKRTKPRKKDLDRSEEDRTIKRTKNK